MQKKYSISLSLAVLLLMLSFSYQMQAQAFRKGSLLVSISEGSNYSNYSTSDNTTGKPAALKTEVIQGTRDPIIIEYGISNKFSIGLTSGADVFNINPSQFYGVESGNKSAKATTSEVTIDCGYHFFVNKRLDMSVFTAMGAFSVVMKGGNGDATYKYTANGNIARVGTRVRYYFFRRLGAFGMLSSYTSSGTTQGVKDNTVANNYKTSINGFTIEAGLCFRVLR
jgi:hypothetical protein